MMENNNLYKQLHSLIEGIPYLVTNLSNISAFLFQNFSGLNWVGFYLLDQDQLVLGPFQGKPACIKIPLGKGVCGTAALKNQTLLVKDVHAFPGHIACDSASASELVVPIHKNDRVVAVLDIDSPVIGRFSEDDRDVFEKIVRLIEEEMSELFGEMI